MSTYHDDKLSIVLGLLTQQLTDIKERVLAYNANKEFMDELAARVGHLETIIAASQFAEKVVEYSATPHEGRVLKIVELHTAVADLKLRLTKLETVIQSIQFAEKVVQRAIQTKKVSSYTD